MYWTESRLLKFLVASVRVLLSLLISRGAVTTSLSAFMIVELPYIIVSVSPYVTVKVAQVVSLNDDDFSHLLGIVFTDPSESEQSEEKEEKSQVYEEKDEQGGVRDEEN